MGPSKSAEQYRQAQNYIKHVNESSGYMVPLSCGVNIPRFSTVVYNLHSCQIKTGRVVHHKQDVSWYFQASKKGECITEYVQLETGELHMSR